MSDSTNYHAQMLKLGRQYLAEKWLEKASDKTLIKELSECRNSPTLMGDGAAILIAREIDRRGVRV